MTIIVKNKQTLIFDEFIFKCCVGKNGFTNNKIEGDKNMAWCDDVNNNVF